MAAPDSNQDIDMGQLFVRPIRPDPPAYRPNATHRTSTRTHPTHPLNSETNKKGKGSPHPITQRRVSELIPVLGSQPAGDASHKPDGRLPLAYLRGLLPILLLGEERHDACEQFA